MAGCSEHPSGFAEEDPELHEESGEFVLDSRAPSEQELQSLFYSTAQKRKIGRGVAHYQFDIRLGPNPFDKVRIHRVVRETAPYRPVKTRGSVFMTTGAFHNFESNYLKAGVENPDGKTSIAHYLAENNIDVWGMDFGWSLVPEETTDFTYLKDWGVERDAADTFTAMSIARFLRGLTGQGFGRMHLLGFSYGAIVTYATAGRETQHHRFLRNIRGIIPVDSFFKDPNDPNSGCTESQNLRNLIESGVFNRSAEIFSTFSNLAKTDPDGKSPFIDGQTNYQAALFVGTNPQVFWHFVAVDFSEAGIPEGLLYTDPIRWIELIGSLPPYMPVKNGVDSAAVRCESIDAGIDTHLSEISVPILSVAAGGGIGPAAHHATTLTVSNDITTHTISLHPEDMRHLDFGHADLVLAHNAPELFWEELRRWLTEHNKPKTKGHTLGLGQRK